MRNLRGVTISALFPDDGLAIAAAGMLIVFAALILIALTIQVMPRVLTVINRWLPEKVHHQSVSVGSEGQLPDEAMLAAIGYVLHTEMCKQRADSGTSD